MGGTIALLMSDLFTSVTTNPDYSFALFDNVQVLEGLIPLESAELSGDYNDDGAVDAADYIVWRKNAGTMNMLPNDDDLPGPIGMPHYDLWRTDFGQTSGGGAATGFAVPEATSLVMLLIGGLAMVCHRKTR
jgi:hypothetical protein